MKIGIDARLINETGVGRYIRNLLRELQKTDTENEYVIFLRKDAYLSFQLPNKRWKKIIADIRWHTLKEQLVMPMVFYKEHLDLLHVPYFNIPLLYFKKFIVTIHDLTIYHVHTGEASTLPRFFYTLKRIGYNIVLRNALKNSSKIIAVSHATKNDITQTFALDSSKIIVTYEAVDQGLENTRHTLFSRKTVSVSFLIKDNYFLYVGNAYPHKNLKMLIKAFLHFSKGSIKLILVGKKDYFYSRLKEYVDALNAQDSVQFFGYANDSELANLYLHAIALVLPSLKEGFGLPGLEAMACGCPVVCSDIPVFHEIYSYAAIYFNPQNSKNMIEILEKCIQDNSRRDTLIKLGRKRAKQYSWSKLAKQTIALYTKTT